MTGTDNLFFELMQVSLGCKDHLTRNLTEKEWNLMFAMAQKQAVAGVAFVVLEGLVSQGQKLPKGLLLEWIGLSEQIRARNTKAMDV